MLNPEPGVLVLPFPRASWKSTLEYSFGKSRTLSKLKQEKIIKSQFK